MKSEKGYLELRDQIIALLLRYGTCLATTLIAIGVASTASKPFWGTSLLPLHSDIVSAGITLLILLPVLRVILMPAFLYVTEIMFMSRLRLLYSSLSP